MRGLDTRVGSYSRDDISDPSLVLQGGIAPLSLITSKWGQGKLGVVLWFARMWYTHPSNKTLWLGHDHLITQLDIVVRLPLTLEIVQIRLSIDTIWLTVTSGIESGQ